MPAIFTAKPRVVIAGAGFGGLFAAKCLCLDDFSVTLADKRNHHTFLPLLYQVAAAELEPEQIAFPARGVFRDCPQVSFAMTEVTGLDPAGRVLRTGAGELPYDYLILALGSQTNYFGVPGAREHAFGLKTLSEGATLRNHILSCFERAALCQDARERDALLTFVVIGGGATGVEYAGALRELISGPLCLDYRCAGSCGARVILLEAGDRLLPGFSPRLSRYAADRLARMGVSVRFGAKVSGISPDTVSLGEGEHIAARTAVWSAGVRGPEVAGNLGLELGPNGRIKVLASLQTPDHPEIFAVGDMAVLEDAPHLPMTAPAAIQQGRHAAANVIRLASGQRPIPFVFKDRGMMAVIGRGKAVAAFGKAGLTGFFAWMAWLFIHVAWLIGFRNRFVALLTWAGDYFFFERSVRLILPGPKRGEDV